ncbi:YbaB/EbfC family nucleoid-associated protein [[Mycoplasma] falconis]|uniref:Nucleoid-associated protein FJO69_02270 n=1 Tax=[Mycoplasma] falconis TaxID=92403 RepID=A0A501XA22_9BACT|nr:YbaB/EbfC family nucleoid-associated protein [[Mycoplasma] falconis]TPE57217.1 YbaB/EbfC family nucleoid-associated protein [[Mycoplasma] falconis]
MNMNNMQDLLKKAKKMQAEMEQQESAIAEQEFIVEKQGIKVVLTGNRRIKEIQINEALIDPDDPELVQDLVMLAVNEGLAKIDETYDSLTSKFGGAGGFPF